MKYHVTPKKAPSADQMHAALADLRRAMARAEKVITEATGIFSLKEVTTDRKREVEQIAKVCARHFNVDAKKIFSRDRTQPLADARLVTMALVRARLELTSMETGRLFARDHGTILYATFTVNGRRVADAAFKKVYNAIWDELDHSTNGAPHAKN